MKTAVARLAQRRYLMTKPVEAITGFCVRYPVPTLSAVLLLTVVSIFFAFCYLKAIPADFQGTMAPHSLGARLAAEFVAEVDDPIEGCIVVEQRDSSTTAKELELALETVVAELKDRPELFNVLSIEFDGDSFKTNRAFFYSGEETRRVDDLIATAKNFQRGDWHTVAPDFMADYLRGLVEYDLRNNVTNESTSDSLLAFTRALAQATSPQTKSAEEMRSPILDGIEKSIPERLNPSYVFRFQSTSAHVGVVTFAFENELSEAEFLQAVRVVENIVSRTQEKNSRTYVEATGLPFLEKREFIAFKSAGRAAAVFMIASVIVFFWAFYGRFSRAFVALFALCAAFGWTTGFQTLVFHDVSPDNVVPWIVVFCLAVDFISVYFANYHHRLRAGASAGDALMQTATTTGASFMTFAVALSVVFFCFALAAPATSELCLVISAGVLLDAIATLIALPAAFRLLDGRRPFRRSSQYDALMLEREQANPYIRTLAIGVMIVTAIICIGLARVQYDPTRSAFHERRFENIRSQEVASRFLENNALYATLFANSIEDGRRIVAQLAEDPELFIDDIASHFPEVTPDDVARVDGYRAALSGVEPKVGNIPIPSREKFKASLIALRDAATGALPSRTEELMILDYMNASLEQIDALSDAELERRLVAFSRLAAVSILNRIHTLYEGCDSHAPCLDDLSDALKTRYIGNVSGRNIIRVYSLRPLSKSQNLKNFVTMLREIDPDVTGPAVLAYEEGRQTGTTCNVFLVVLVVFFAGIAYFRFRFLKAPLAVVVLVTLTCLEVVGVAGLFGICINPINWLIFPCLLCLSLYGAFRFAEDYEEDDERVVSGEHVLATASGAAVVAGFFTCGLVCPEQGWQELARLGVFAGAAYVASSLVLVPAILNWHAIEPEDSVVGEGVDERELDAAESAATDVKNEAGDDDDE